MRNVVSGAGAPKDALARAAIMVTPLNAPRIKQRLQGDHGKVRLRTFEARKRIRPTRGKARGTKRLEVLVKARQQ